MMIIWNVEEWLLKKEKKEINEGLRKEKENLELKEIRRKKLKKRKVNK